MHLSGKIWATITYITAWLNPAPIDETFNQRVLVNANPSKDVTPQQGAAGWPWPGFPDFPKFTAPDSTNRNFTCSYPDMSEWTFCSIPENRECWLRHRNGTELGIHTDYERIAPKGITRNYTITIADGKYNGDGMTLKEAKLIDGDFPGPYIEACWGDTVNIKVINKMKHNGTSIHWHGIRQYNSMHMDGVNGITQCPIAPGDSFTYSWRALQYGSSWYHSHYSVQYADGVQGPMTIHGPASGSYDYARFPLIMTDWGHNSAFQALHKDPKTNATYGVKAPSILLNGTGNIERYSGGVNTATDFIPTPYTLIFEKRNHNMTNPGKAKRYLLRLINTSFDTTFVFSIDNHWMQVIQADFVPIEPYFTTSVLVGIGQRYHVVVEARPDQLNETNAIPADGNFWIRTFVADGCGKVPKYPNNKTVVAGYEAVGILRYNNLSTTNPISEPWGNIPLECSDEPYEKLIPKRPWYVGKPVNAGFESEEDDTGEWFDINMNRSHTSKAYPLGFFSMDRHYYDEIRHQDVATETEATKNQTTQRMYPFRVDYSKPMFLNLSHHGEWEKEHVVVPENFGDDDWVYLTILGGEAGGRSPVVAHPIHLHGHDFALLQQSKEPFSKSTWHPSQMKLINPPRRDVVLVPEEGFVIIAFKTDNPGNWLMHCHIARHASEGLSLQILERQDDAYRMWPENSQAAVAAERLCHNWNVWVSDCQKWWHSNETSKSCDPEDPTKPINGYIFQDDSGI